MDHNSVKPVLTVKLVLQCVKPVLHHKHLINFCIMSMSSKTSVKSVKQLFNQFYDQNYQYLQIYVVSSVNWFDGS